jgi:hypothetical protein
MYELLAIAVGAGVGAGLALVDSVRASLLLVTLGAAGAIAAFTLSGELELTPAFLAWDAAQVVLAAVLVRVAVLRFTRARR